MVWCLTINAANHLNYDAIGLGVGVPEDVDATGRLTSREVLDWASQPGDVLGRIAPKGRCLILSEFRVAAQAEATLGHEEAALRCSMSP